MLQNFEALLLEVRWIKSIRLAVCMASVRS
jgi:hypothetical protein